MNKRHAVLLDQPYCSTEAPVDGVGVATRAIYEDVDCPDCLRRMIDESEERARVLHELLARVRKGTRDHD